MNRAAFALFGIVVSTSLGCAAAAVPTGWKEGGRRLEVPTARWVVGERTVELAPNGSVIVDGAHTMTVDRAGRVYGPENRPIALLKPDGTVLGPDDEPLGWVGATEARGDDNEPWLTYLPSGEVVRLLGDGQPRPFGVWLGCEQVPYGSQTCLLVTHLVGLELRTRAASPGVSVGVGLGLGVGIGVGVP